MPIRSLARTTLAVLSFVALGHASGVAAQNTNFTLTAAIVPTPGGNPSASACVTELESNVQSGPPYGFVAYNPPAPATLSSLATLAAIYSFPTGHYFGGSPRFELSVNSATLGSHSVFVYLGTPPGFTDAGHASFVASGNMIGAAGARWDTSQFAGGSQTSNYTDAITLLGTATVEQMAFVVDGGWGVDGPQVALLDTLTVDANVYQTICPPPRTRPVTAVPTLGEWSLALLALMLGALGWAALRRRTA